MVDRPFINNFYPNATAPLNSLLLPRFQSQEVLQNMNEWCVEHHNASGLTDRVRASSVSIEEADKRLHQFVAKYVKPKTAPMVGEYHTSKELLKDRLESKYLMRICPFCGKFHQKLVKTVGEHSLLSDNGLAGHSVGTGFGPYQ
ncbi:uncharacterized protein LOC113471323 [Diaphorina citri]|uniref:Uncharacterized protein LOC113471323 n=1 Tax=Diaphorina citri TaxID=121845 RepID=A0A3Q0JCP5_DIACI|nr:uncharacterized protein LOC113471323 [Diaphorina citri]